MYNWNHAAKQCLMFLYELIMYYQIEKRLTKDIPKLVFYDSQIEKLKNYNVMMRSTNIIANKDILSKESGKKVKYNVDSGAPCYDLMSFFLNYGGYNGDLDILNQRCCRPHRTSRVV